MKFLVLALALSVLTPAFAAYCCQPKATCCQPAQACCAEEAIEAAAQPAAPMAAVTQRGEASSAESVELTLAANKMSGSEPQSCCFLESPCCEESLGCCVSSS